MLDGGFKTDFTTILQQMLVSKTHELLTYQDIIKMFEERAMKKVKYHIPGQLRAIFYW